MAISLLSWVNYWWMRIVGGGEKSIDDAMAIGNGGYCGSDGDGARIRWDTFAEKISRYKMRTGILVSNHRIVTPAD